jgi:hypothetical protein
MIKKAITIEYIFNVIKSYRRRAVNRYNESRANPIHCEIDYAYYNGMVKVLDELKNEIKEASK